MYIKKFIDKVSGVGFNDNKPIILPVADAIGLRDEIAKLLLDLNDLKNNKSEVISVELTGGKF